MGNDETGTGGQREEPPRRPPSGPPSASPREPPRCLRSEELFSGQPEIIIVHEGETYRLRVTRNGKLILHK